MKYYTYVFVRQDISPEQQLVQAAHATFLLGVQSQRVDTDFDWCKTGMTPCLMNENVNAAETYFTVVGVRDLRALQAVRDILIKFGYLFEMFFEPDIKPEGEHTAIATYPIPEDQRDVLMAFNLLKFK
jgi:hypothetical protein